MEVIFKGFFTGFENGSFEDKDQNRIITYHKAVFLDGTKTFSCSVSDDVYSKFRDIAPRCDYKVKADLRSYAKDLKLTVLEFSK